MVSRDYKNTKVRCYLCKSFEHIAPFCDSFNSIEEISKMKFKNIGKSKFYNLNHARNIQ